MKTIKRIDIFSVAKILGIIYACIGLLIGCVFTGYALIAFLTLSPGALNSGDPVALPLVISTGFLFILPILYGLIGFVAGLVLAALYNFLAGKIGGIQIELE